eukprot:TRINITY_DN1839_c0_g1_i1.p1 TRINITY_DN1839_c0_g1~~TRINITY_DN1839_c0_g1_i1.p1  ORF type:complete len:721 (+),score=272.83 TRINITY_DN1839_c0_g1_i1:146-2308(+)
MKERKKERKNKIKNENKNNNNYKKNREMKIENKLMMIVVIIMMSQIGMSEGSWWDNLLNPRLQHSPNLSKSQLYEIQAGLENIEGYVAAFGDFNSDKLTDAFVVRRNSDDTETVAVFLWDSKNFQYKPLKKGTLNFTSTVANVAPGDYNWDGKLDIAVTTVKEKGVSYEVRVFYGGHDEFIGNNAVATVGSELLMFDYNGDLVPDFFGLSESGERYYYVNNGTGYFEGQKQTLEGTTLNELHVPTSNAFVDLNGDCLADLVVISRKNASDATSDIENSNYKEQYEEQGYVQYLEIWINKLKKGNYFSFNKQYALPPGTRQFTFSDFNQDGTNDILFPVCYPESTCSTENSIHIIYNSQQQMCSGITGTGSSCYSPGNLCSGNKNFTFPADFTVDSNKGNADIVIVDVPTPFLINDVVPLTLRAGDYNIDGYPDILIPIYDESKETSFIQLWKNIECDDDICNTNTTSNHRRSFKLQTDGTDVLSSGNFEDAFVGAFVDLDELGKLDIIVLTYEGLQKNPPTNPSFGVLTVYNNYDNNAFFLKALGLNGKCPEWCIFSDQDEPTFPDPRPYGVNMPGGTFKFTITNTKGKKFPVTGTQLSQSAHLALQTPYIIFGLGKVSNFIETFNYGVSIASDNDHFNSYPGVIPNSQVAVFPNPPKKPGRWKTEMYIIPSYLTFYVILACIIVCIFLSIFVFYLAYRDKKADDLEAKEKAHLYSFNAL